MSKLAVLTALALAAMPVSAQSAWSQPANPSGAINVGGPTFYGTDQISVDVFKQAELWWTPNPANGFYALRPDVPLDTDAQGWLRSLPIVDGVEREVIAPFSTRDNLRLGRYVVTWSGDGIVEFDGTVVQRQTRRLLIDIPQRQFHWLTIRSTDPAKTGKYIRDIRIYKVEDEPLIRGGELFQPGFIDKVSQFRMLRMTAAQNMNFTKVKDWIPERELSTRASWSEGVPIDVLIRLSNIAKADLWISVPHLATDDYVRKMAGFIRARLNPSLRVYLEYSNEFFTSSFDQYSYFQAQADLKFGTGVRNGNAQFYASRATQIFDIFNTTFGASNAARLFPVLAINRGSTLGGGPGGQPGTADDMLTGPDVVRVGGKRPIDGLVKVLAIDTYVGFELPQNEVAALQDAPDGAGRVITALRSGTGFSYPVGVPVFRAGVRAFKQFTDRYRLQLFAYEGGTALVNFLPGEPAAQTDFVSKINRDPRIVDLYRDMYSAWRAEGGKLNVHFASFGFDSAYGNWGTWQDVFQPQTTPRGTIPVADNDTVFSDPSDLRPGSTFQNGRVMLGTAADDNLVGTAYADAIYGGDGNDTLTGGGGADKLSGGTGGDTFVVALVAGSGTQIVDLGVPNDGPDTLRLTDNVSAGQLVFTRSVDDLIIAFGARSIVIRGQYKTVGLTRPGRIETLKLADGTTISLPELQL